MGVTFIFGLIGGINMLWINRRIIMVTQREKTSVYKHQFIKKITKI